METIRIIRAGYATYPRGATFGPRLLDSCEFVWIVRGHATAWYDDQTVDAPAGSLLLSRAGMTDEYHWDTRGPTVHAYFHFTLDTDYAATLPDPASWPICRPMADHRLLGPLMQYVTDTRTATPGESRIPRDCARILLELYLGMERGRQGPPDRGAHSPHVERAHIIMGEMARQSPIPTLSLKTLADRVHISAGHLCLLFMREVRRSPLAAYRDMRLQCAEQLLTRSNLSIKEIAEATGFANQYHFSRCFKEKYRQSPRVYRRDVKG